MTIIAPNVFDSLIDRMLRVVTLWRLQLASPSERLLQFFGVAVRIRFSVRAYTER